MYVRYSLSLERPVETGLGLADFRNFLNDVILAIFSNRQGYKPNNCNKIEVVGRVFYSTNGQQIKKAYPAPHEFKYVSTDEIILKQVIEQQIKHILLQKVPKNCYKIKIKFIIKFYLVDNQ